MVMLSDSHHLRARSCMAPACTSLATHVCERCESLFCDEHAPSLYEMPN